MSIFSIISNDDTQTLNQGLCFKKLAWLAIFILALFIGGKLFASCYFHSSSHHIEQIDH